MSSVTLGVSEVIKVDSLTHSLCERNPNGIGLFENDQAGNRLYRSYRFGAIAIRGLMPNDFILNASIIDLDKGMKDTEPFYVLGCGNQGEIIRHELLDQYPDEFVTRLFAWNLQKLSPILREDFVSPATLEYCLKTFPDLRDIDKKS